MMRQPERWRMISPTPGARIGTKIAKGSVRLKKPKRLRTYHGRKYDVGVWTSPWASEPFGFTEIIPSWQATTPGDSWIEIKARLRAARERLFVRTTAEAIQRAQENNLL